AFLTNLQTQNIGDSTFGYRLFDASNQAAIVPWFNIDRLSVRFTKNVNVAADDLQLFGANTASYTLPAAGFSYDPATFTATWSITGGIDQDKLRIVVDGSPTGVTAVVGGKQLDGEWNDDASVYPSGDGSPGGNFSFRFNTQPGDAMGDGFVNVTDCVGI